MTIDSGWVKIVKENVPCAFTRSLSCPVHTVFIDGQINLMKADFIHTWKLFLQVQFIDKVQRAFQSGARVVVVAFDDYAHVPMAKNMTQTKRGKNIPVLEFAGHEELPSVMPVNWAGAMRNRVFKTKVAAFVCQNMAIHFQQLQSGSLVLDFNSRVQVVGNPLTLSPEVASEEAKRGECDIKAFSYLHVDGPLLIESIDGDFLPLALLQIQKKLQETNHEYEVILHRMRTRTTADTNNKRAADGRAKREYEFVHVNHVLPWVLQEFKHMPNPVSAFAALIAATGCDFCMSLPNLGPVRLWKYKHLMSGLDLTLAPALLQALSMVYYRHYAKQMTILGSRYNIKFTADMPIEAALTQYALITREANAGNMRCPMWWKERMHAHVLNTLWTLQYWIKTCHYEDCFAQNYGYVKVKENAKVKEKAQFAGLHLQSQY